MWRRIGKGGRWILVAEGESWGVFHVLKEQLLLVPLIKGAAAATGVQYLLLSYGLFRQFACVLVADIISSYFQRLAGPFAAFLFWAHLVAMAARLEDAMGVHPFAHLETALHHRAIACFLFCVHGLAQRQFG